MTEKKKNELIDNLKLAEQGLQEGQVDLGAINTKLKIANDYETELLERLEAARANTKKLKKEFFLKVNEQTAKVHHIKNILDIYTGHWYTNLLAD